MFFYLMASLPHSFAGKVLNRADIERKSYDIEFVESLKKEVIDHFTLLGSPITPILLEKTRHYLSDLIPSIIAIDLLATIDSNEFHGEYITKKGGKYTWHSVSDKQTHEIEEYAVLGRIGLDKVVVLSRSNGGGTLTQVNLVVFKIELEKCWTVDPSKQEYIQVARYRLVAKQVAHMNIKNIGHIEIKDNELIIKDEKDKIKKIDLTKIKQS